MKELKPRIHENGIDYILVGDYYVPDLKLPEEHRPIGKSPQGISETVSPCRVFHPCSLLQAAYLPC